MWDGLKDAVRLRNSPFAAALVGAGLVTLVIQQGLLWAQGLTGRIPWWSELLAWAAATGTYAFFVPADLLFGPRRGLQRLPDAPWGPIRLYAALYLGTCFGVVLALALLAALWWPRHQLALRGLPYLWITYQFLVRHWLTETKATPHLGQRSEGRTREVIWGQIGDLVLVAILATVGIVTEHAIWLLSSALILSNYMLGVWIHRHWDPEPRPATSYAGTLLSLVFACGLVLILGTVPSIPNDLKDVQVILAVIGVVFLVDRQKYPAALVALVLLLIAGIVLRYIGDDRLFTGFGESLLSARLNAKRIIDYWMFLATVMVQRK